MNAQKKTYVNKKFLAKLIIKIMLLGMLISMSLLLFNASINTDSILSYNASANIDYKVYLKENSFYKDRYLGKNMTYITSLVDYIDMDFNYNFAISEKSNIDYKYTIYANLVITPEDSTSVLFDETYILLSDTVSNMFKNSDKYNLSETVKLDYNHYNDLANTFKATYGVSCDSTLYVGLTVDTDGKDLKYETDFNSSNNVKIAFSLTKKQVDIDMKLANLDTRENLNIEASTLIRNKGFLVLGIVLIGISILLIVSIAKTIMAVRAQTDGYTRYIEKILNNYDRAIVETKYIPDLEEYEVIEVGKFSELLDVRDTLRLPIIYSPIKEKESCFYIRQEKTIYMHYVKSTSLVVIDNKFNNLFM